MTAVRDRCTSDMCISRRSGCLCFLSPVLIIMIWGFSPPYCSCFLWSARSIPSCSVRSSTGCAGNCTAFSSSCRGKSVGDRSYRTDRTYKTYHNQRNDLKIATAARARQAMIAAVQMTFQTFSGIFVLRFITQSVPASVGLRSGTKSSWNEKDGSPFGKPS